MSAAASSIFADGMIAAVTCSAVLPDVRLVFALLNFFLGWPRLCMERNGI
jgi:hypothetical protein